MPKRKARRDNNLIYGKNSKKCFGSWFDNNKNKKRKVGRPRSKNQKKQRKQINVSNKGKKKITNTLNAKTVINGVSLKPKQPRINY